MTTTTNTAKYNKANIMRMAWQFVKRNGFSLAEALKTAWRNAKVKIAMYNGIVRFTFKKVDGSLREAFGTLKASLLPPTQGNRRENPTLQTYFDTEKGEYRCFKVANLISIG